MFKPVHSEVIVIFRVHAPLASSRERVWLLGSLPELGEWCPARAIETGQVEGEWKTSSSSVCRKRKVWQARVRMPMNTRFQWAWCTLLGDGRIKHWELTQRRTREVFSFSGVLHTAWGDSSIEIFKQNMGSALLLTQRRTKRMDVVAVVGSCPSLGSWDPTKAAVANEFPPRSGRWSVTVYYDSAAMLEWNWVIISKDTKEVKLTENRNTRFLFESHGWIKLHAPWNKEAQAVDWTPKEHCGGGDFQLGTVELLNFHRDRRHEIKRWEEKAESCRLTGRTRGMFSGVTATLQLETPLPPRTPPSPRLLESASFPSDWADSHKPDEEGTNNPMPPKPLLPAILDDFKTTLKIKPYCDEPALPRAQGTPQVPPPTPRQPSFPPAFPSAVAPTSAVPPAATTAGARVPPSPVSPSDGKYATPMTKPVAATPPQQKSPTVSPMAAPPTPPPTLSRQVPPSLIHKSPPYAAHPERKQSAGVAASPQQPPSLPSPPIAQAPSQPSPLSPPQKPATPSSPQHPEPLAQRTMVPSPLQQHQGPPQYPPKPAPSPQQQPADQKSVASPQQAQTTAAQPPQRDSTAPGAPTSAVQTTTPQPAAMPKLEKEYSVDSRRSSVSSQQRGSLVSRMSCGLVPPLKIIHSEGSSVSSDVDRTDQEKVKTVETGGRQAAANQVPIDITKAGYTLAPCPSKSKGHNRDLVSDPGRPGFTDGLAAVHVSMLNENRENLAALGPHHKQSLDELPVTTPFTSPPVRRIEEINSEMEEMEPSCSSRRASEFPLGTRAGSNTSLASIMGIMGAACDKPQPDLVDLRQLAEQREQARKSDRLRGVMDREERNRTKFEESKQLEMAQMAQPAMRIRRSHAPKKDQGTET